MTCFRYPELPEGYFACKKGMLTIEAKTVQLQYESDCWKRSLEFIISENVYSKNRLAEVTRNSRGDHAFLEQAEFYQNYFIQQETLMALLRSDIFAFDKLLQKKDPADSPPQKEMEPARKKILHEMEKLEQEFSKTKRRFNLFLNTLI